MKKLSKSRTLTQTKQFGGILDNQPKNDIRLWRGHTRQAVITCQAFRHELKSTSFLSKLVDFWRRKRDSNPRGLSPKRFSRPPRYDRFDIPAKIINLYKVISYQTPCPLLYPEKQILSMIFTQHFSYIPSYDRFFFDSVL